MQSIERRGLEVPDQSSHPWRVSSTLWNKLKPLARQMRLQPTPAEKLLWGQLRKNRLGVKFRRQYVIERFVVDFYCAEKELIIEVDGKIHQYTVEEDEVRQAFLESVGLRVLRFSNSDVLNNLSDVLDVIQMTLVE